MCDKKKKKSIEPWKTPEQTGTGASIRLSTTTYRVLPKRLTRISQVADQFYFTEEKPVNEDGMVNCVVSVMCFLTVQSTLLIRKVCFFPTVHAQQNYQK